MSHNFSNVKFNSKVYNNATTKWKDFEEGVYKIEDKVLLTSKFGESYILELVDEQDNTTKVYTPKAVTKYLKDNNPKYIKVINKNGINQAQFP